MFLKQVERHVFPFYCWVDEVTAHYFRIYDIHGEPVAKLFRDPLELDADYVIRANAIEQPELYAALRYALDSACRYIAHHGWTAFRKSDESA